MRFEEEISVKANPEAIYNLLAKSTNFAKLVPELKVKIIEKDEDYHISQWQLDTEKETFKWQARENFDPELLTINYSLIEGDWQHFDGRWKITPNGEESELIFQAEIIPPDQGPLKNYLYWFFFRKQMRQVCREIVHAVRDRLELSYGQSL